MLLIGSLLATGCSDSRPTSVLLITLDTTRADRLGCYGRTEAGTPVLDRLAREGALFERAYCSVPITLPSHTSILTGTYPIFHGVRDNGSFVASSRLTTLAEILKEEDYRTGAFIASYPLSSAFGLDQGFEVYDEQFGATDDARRVFLDERPADQVVERASAWIEKTESDDAFFAWVHFFDPHAPYEPPADLRGKLSDPYQGEIAGMDRALGELVKTLERLDRLDDTLIVVVADHGEGLGEHGEGSHAALIYDSTMRVPMIVRGPEVPATRVRPLARTIDIVPTVTDLLGISQPKAVQGRSLRPLWQGRESDPRPVYLETLWPKLHQGWSPLEGMVLADRKMIRATALPATTPELYDVVSDPAELHDLALAEPGKVQDLVQRLDRLIESKTSNEFSRERSLTEADLESLRQLGYIGPSPDPQEANRHPKDAMLAFTGLQRAATLVVEERFEEALALLDQIESDYPFSLGVFEYRGLCFKQMGRSVDPAYFEKALQQYRRALEINPLLEEVWRNLGEVHLILGNTDDAIACYQQARRIAPGLPKTEKNFAIVLARAGRQGDAVEVLEAVIADHPGRLDARNELAGLLEEMERLEDALEAYEETCRRGVGEDPDVIRAHNRAGVLAARLNRSAKAIEHFRAVNRVRPDNVFARPKLAVELERIGRTQEALQLWTELANEHPDEPTFFENRDRLKAR
ncbi:MAG: sulfatase-like hydrolase/transferase [Planctomycetota bacterium]